MPTGPGVSSPRRVLRRLIEVMAAPGTAQARLDRVATLIALEMVAEVCSIYLLRAGEVLELFATEGLRKDAVHHTRLRVGEGLVGTVAASARALNLADAQSHPKFVYRPETGEEIYRSLMGVPILHAGRVAGVLVIQNRTSRHYTDEEVEALEIIAMVLAELVAGGELVSRDEILPVDGNATLPLRLEGVRLNAGLAIGRALLYQPQIHIDKLVADDPQAELARLRDALTGMQSAIDTLIAEHDVGAGEHRDVLETYRMFAEDRGWVRNLNEAILSGLTAEAAIKMVQDDTRARMAQITDPYLRERLADLDDLTNRLFLHLSGSRSWRDDESIPNDVILFARNLGPAELLDFPRAKLKGLVLEEGSANAHVVIVARALDVPVVGRVEGSLTRVLPGDPVIIDGDNAQVMIRPGEDIQQDFAASVQARAERQVVYVAMRHLPAVTRDGVEISLNVNAGLLIDLQHLHDWGADGVGLYRTEVPFMVRSEYPDVAAQASLYGRIFDQAGDKPVIFRTLDIGGDKLLPYWSPAREENPAMGWRAIRIALDRPALLRQQLRALVMAAKGRPLQVMFPMVAEVSELDRARSLLDREIRAAQRRGEQTPEQIRVGAMVEVPALAWQLDALFERADFLSLGTNDFFQFFFASDRSNPQMTERYDVLSPPPLRFLAELARRCGRANIPLTVCGEIAGQPLEALALLALGYRRLSMAPPSLGPVKAMIRTTDLRHAAEFVTARIAKTEASLRSSLRDFAVDHRIAI
ncbi:MAG: phosphoenolpyruvate--protein phosphotransferase [Alphaproteobacteria bacterium]